MTHLFSRANQDLIERFASPNVLLAFDYDGTLAPLVSEPGRAAMRLSTLRPLRRLPAGALPVTLCLDRFVTANPTYLRGPK